MHNKAKGGLYIFTFDKQKIVRLVCASLHIHEDDSEVISELCDDACGYVSSLLCKEPENETQVSLCERAVASIVIYDYTQVKCACTGPGTDGKTPSVQHAKEIMELAFSRLGGLIRDTGVFYFTGVDS